MSESRSSALVKNIFLFFLASFGPKFISFFLVPLYTSVVSTDAYGTIDLLATIVSLALPILMVDISDAIMFFGFKAEQTEEKQQPFLFGMQIHKISSVVVAVIALVVGFVYRDLNTWIYCLYVVVLYINQALRLNLLAYMRTTNMVNSIVISSIVTSVITLLLNVLLLLVFNLGLYGLLISTAAGEIANNVYCLIVVKYKKVKKTPFTLTKEQKKAMLKYSFPLIFTGIAWWVNSSLNRFFIVGYCGVSENGIYAVANKIPTLLTAVHSVIYQALQLSVFAEMKSKDSSAYMKKLYQIYNFIMVLTGSVLILLNKPLAYILFKGEFFVAWKYVPAILLSSILYSVAGYTTIIAAASAKTSTITISTIAGAACNALVTWLLIPKIGIYGAVIATICGYFVVWLILILKIESHLKIKFPKIQSIAMYAILALQWWINLTFRFDFLINLVLTLLIFLICFETVKDLFSIGIALLKKIISAIRNRKNLDA